jgi:hypothetical protein
MGGSAFNFQAHGFATPRMSPSQYHSLTQTILPLLTPLFQRTQIPHPAPKKPTYGDLDIFVSEPLNDLSPHAAIAHLSHSLGPRCRGIICNLPTTNIAVLLGAETFQVDVHVVPRAELWDLDFWMHSWGDLGMIVSATIKAWGMRLSSSRGLYFHIQGYGPFILSWDIERIVAFLDLDWKRYQQGFETVEEIFEWIRGVRILGQEVGIKSLGKLDKKGQEERKMWRDYWSRGDNTVAYSPSPEEIERVRQQALAYFSKDKEYQDVLTRLDRERVAREKFNGHRVMEWTSFQGRRLGILMKRLREEEDLSFERIEGMDMDQIRDVVMETWRKMQSELDGVS